MSRWILLVSVLVLSMTMVQGQVNEVASLPLLTITDMFNNVNALRQNHQRPPLTINNSLTQAAQEQADYISRTGNYAHVHGGSSPASRAMNAAYQTTEWCCSENTHRTQIGKSAWEFWNNSRSHYYNMLNPEWTEIGLATSNVGSWTGWVLVFGSGIQSPPPQEAAAPALANSAPAVQIPAATNPLPTAGGYRVVWGDTLSNIARRYAVTVSALKAANGLAGDLIYEGQMLVIPDGQALPVSQTADSNITTRITSPVSGAVMRPGFPIIGTARFDAAQAQYYKVEISGGQFGDRWVTIGDIHTGSVSNAQLEFLNAVAPGRYTLRLLIIGTDNSDASSASVSFEVRG